MRESGYSSPESAAAEILSDFYSMTPEKLKQKHPKRRTKMRIQAESCSELNVGIAMSRAWTGDTVLVTAGRAWWPSLKKYVEGPWEIVKESSNA